MKVYKIGDKVRIRVIAANRKLEELHSQFIINN